MRSSSANSYSVLSRARKDIKHRQLQMQMRAMSGMPPFCLLSCSHYEEAVTDDVNSKLHQRLSYVLHMLSAEATCKQLHEQKHLAAGFLTIAILSCSKVQTTNPNSTESHHSHLDVLR